MWRTDWGVHLQPAGSGAAALKYLGTYITRTAISDQAEPGAPKRFAPQAPWEAGTACRWKDRARHRTEKLTLPGMEFVRRYLRHVLPRGLRAIRYYGFCHPRAQAKRLRVQFLSGRPVQLGATASTETPQASPPLCPCCQQPMQLLRRIQPAGRSRAPPTLHRLRPVALQRSL